MKIGRTSVLMGTCGVLVVAACSGKLVIDDSKGNVEGKDGGGGASSANASGGSGGGVDAGGVVGPVAAGGAGSGGVDAGSGGSQFAAGGATSREAGTGPATRWTGNPSDCPAAPPAKYQGPCGVPLGETCAWYTPNHQYPAKSDYIACDCLPANETTTLWSCHDGWVGVSCPPLQPEEGSSCSGFTGSQCPYPPYITCTCVSSNRDWHCADQDGPFLPSATHPTTLDETKHVKDLTDAEREAWCEWYENFGEQQGPLHGIPLAPETPLSADGYTTNIECFNNQSGGFACTGSGPAALPISYCKGNLALSTCDAPVSELTDCVLTFQRECRPSPFGCALYFNTPGCSGTEVSAATSFDAGSGPEPPLCSLRVK